MEEKQEVDVGVIKIRLKKPLFLLFAFVATLANAQESNDSTTIYKKKVLDATELSFLMSYYTQDGDNSSVGGGIGSEELSDATPTFVLSTPLNDDDVLTLDFGISAYSSASSSNINPFDGSKEASPFQASSGESQSDALISLNGSFSRSSDDRNTIKTVHTSVSNEYDYFSVGAGAGLTKLFNQKNTSLNVKGNVYIDSWKAIYPIELRAISRGGATGGEGGFNLASYDITGNPNYAPSFSKFTNTNRNSYSLGIGGSQILSKKLQAAVVADLIYQDGLLSTPYHRVYFADVDDAFIQNFQLGDDVEQLPGTRTKVAAGGRLHYYVNERVVIRTYYRYYTDDWGIDGHTASIEIPVKIGNKFTVYPIYRYYTQTAADYFAPFETHLSTQEFYTSDYDLSEFDSDQFGIGLTYRDVFTKHHIGKFGLKSIDVRYNQYERSTGLSANIFSVGLNFVRD